MPARIDNAARQVLSVLIACLPDQQAANAIAGKPVLLTETYNRLLPRLRGRAFTISGITRADTLQAVRDRIADLPRGEDWQAIRGDVLTEISPYLVDPDAEPEMRAKQMDAAARLAELLVRHHGFQAYQAGQYDIMTRHTDALPYWQYVTVGDDNVRDAHRALDGIILPADSPFWRDHYPPWDWGCRCRVVAIDAETRDRAAAGDVEGRVLSPIQERELETANRLADPRTGQVADVAPSNRQGAFRWHPDDMRIPLDDLRASYDPDVFARFEADMRDSIIPELDITVWDWLSQQES